jgi:hypothetical protein
MAAPLTLDEDMMLALLGLPEGEWWNIASDAAGTRSLARRVGCTQERLSAFVKHNKLRGRSMLGTMRKTLTVGEQTLTVFRSDQTSGCGLREHKLRHNHWWSFGTQPAHPAKWFLDNKPDETPGDGGVGGGAAAAHAASSSSSGGDDDDDDDGDSPLSSPSPAEGVYEGVYVTRANVHLVRCGTHLSVWWAGSNGFGGGYELGVVDHVYPEVPWVRVTYTSTSLRYDVNLLDGGKCKIMMGLPPVHGPSPQGPLCSSPSAPTPGGSSSSWTSSSSSSVHKVYLFYVPSSSDHW